MICQFCGAELPEDSIFCDKCGKQLQQPPHDEPPNIHGSHSSAYDEPPSSVNPAAPVDRLPYDRKPQSARKSGMGWIVVCAALCLVIAGGLATWRVWNSAKGQKSEHSAESPVLSDPEPTDPKPGDDDTGGDGDTSESGDNSQEEGAQEEPVVPLEWSDWEDALPEGVTSESYEIEEKVLYHSRDLEKTSSTTTDSMDGWELYDTVDTLGDFGQWSSWSTDKVTKSDSRNVKEKTQYQYQEKVFDTSSSPSLGGDWRLYDTTYPTGAWSEFSAWSETPVSSSDTRKVETRYSYSDIQTATSSSSTKSGWELYDTTYAWSEYGSYSDWQASPISSSESCDVDSKPQYHYYTIETVTENVGWGKWSDWQEDYVATNSTTDVDTRTAYFYYYFCCPSCGAHMHVWSYTCFTWAGGCGKAIIPEGSYTEGYYDTPYSSADDWHGTGRYYTYDAEDGLVFAVINTASDYYYPPITQYRYRTMQTREKTIKSDWSEWFDGSCSGSDTMIVESRTIYRCKTRQQIPTYYFRRWGEWSSWSSNKVSPSDTRKVKTEYRYQDYKKIPLYHFYRWGTPSEWSDEELSETDDRRVYSSRTVYQYQDKVTETTYYFRRWSDVWSDWTDQPITESDELQVESKLVYHYRAKS